MQIYFRISQRPDFLSSPKLLKNFNLTLTCVNLQYIIISIENVNSYAKIFLIFSSIIKWYVIKPPSANIGEGGLMDTCKRQVNTAFGLPYQLVLLYPLTRKYLATKIKKKPVSLGSRLLGINPLEWRAQPLAKSTKSYWHTTRMV